MATFNPNDEFFSKTKYFASQARGKFTVTLPPGTPERPGHFLLSPLPTGLLLSGKTLLEKGLLAKQASVPSVQLNTYEPTSFMGPTRKHAYGMQFSDLSVEFYLMGKDKDEAYSLYYFMYKWLEGIAGPRQGTAADEVVDDQMPRSDSTSYDVRYYENYIAEATLEFYSPNDSASPTMKIKYSELFPIDISGLQYSWESSDTPLTMSVTFAYHYSRPVPIS